MTSKQVGGSLVVFLLLFVIPSDSCKCLFYDFPENLCTRTNSYALRGTAESVFETGGNDTTKGAKFYSVKVKEIFRGKQVILNATGQASIPAGSSIYIQTQRQSAACGTTIPLNTDYVITGYISSGQNVSTSNCDWNKPWSSLSSEYRSRIENYGDRVCSAGKSLLSKKLEWLFFLALCVAFIQG